MLWISNSVRLILSYDNRHLYGQVFNHDREISLKKSEATVRVIWPTCVSWASGWLRLCVRGCAGCPVCLGLSCSHLAPLEASPARGSYRGCSAYESQREQQTILYILIMWEKILCLSLWNVIYIQSYSVHSLLVHEYMLCHSYPRVPRPAMGGLGGFCVGGLVLEMVPPRPAALFPCCYRSKTK